MAAEWKRYGYRRIHLLLQREGITVNHKKVYRIYVSEEFQVRKRKRRKLSGHRGKSFVEYLENSDTVKLYNEHHLEIGEISRNSFREITICCVTLDEFSRFSARIENLLPLGINVKDPVWCVSIDDLRVYVDVFKSPSVFIHYLEVRKRAFLSELIDADDELDHLGLYFKHNDYPQTAVEITKNKKNASVLWHGYRADIDDYYHDLLINPEDASLPTRIMPDLIREIINLLDASVKLGRSKAASLLLAFGAESREDMATKIEEVLAHQKAKGRMFPLLFASKTDLIFYIKQPGINILSSDEIHTHALNSFYAVGKMIRCYSLSNMMAH